MIPETESRRRRRSLFQALEFALIALGMGWELDGALAAVREELADFPPDAEHPMTDGPADEEMQL